MTQFTDEAASNNPADGRPRGTDNVTRGEGTAPVTAGQFDRRATPTSSDPSARRPISVLIADDQSLIRTGFAMVINSQPDMRVVGEAADGRVAALMSRQLRPDVVLMDVRMPVLDGIHATAEIIGRQQQHPHLRPTGQSYSPGTSSPVRQGPEPVEDANGGPRIIILTTFDLDEYVMAAIRAGASGFLLKDSSPEVLLSSIRTVHEGNAIIAPSATKRLIERLVGEPAALADGTEQPLGQASSLAAAQSRRLTAWAGRGSRQTGIQSVISSRRKEPTASFGAALAQTGLSTAPDTPATDSPELAALTEREREVLIELAHGLSNQEIADKLVVSLPTVKTHVAHLLSKINARDRVQAVVFAYENGLVQ